MKGMQKITASTYFQTNAFQTAFYETYYVLQFISGTANDAFLISSVILEAL